MYSSPSPLGLHLIAELFDASALFDPLPAQDALTRAANAAGATLLEVNTHDFGDRAGFTGVALLAESHISVHTWPEHDYAAIDIFMCGDANPQASLKVLESYFAPARTDVQVISRGLLGQPERRLAAGF
ncbi:MAG: adenosylmethionine decarboxylase [Ruegeria sp.]|uniref:adenosylmethionine decarboxylase n=1 Tax=Ruegeria sp. TaxID=1879320 RepID=UPI00349EBAE9